MKADEPNSPGDLWSTLLSLISKSCPAKAQHEDAVRILRRTQRVVAEVASHVTDRIFFQKHAGTLLKGEIFTDTTTNLQW